MTAWQRLKALSALAAGTAWQLISAPKTGVVVNDGIAATVDDIAVTVSLTDARSVVELAPTSVVAEVVDASIIAEVTDAPSAAASPQSINTEIHL